MPVPWNANGATFHFWVVTDEPISRRWHLIQADKLLGVGTSGYVANGLYLPNAASAWSNSWAQDNQPLSAGAPNLTAVKSVGISARGGVPTGKFKIRRFAVTA